MEKKLVKMDACYSNNILTYNYTRHQKQFIFQQQGQNENFLGVFFWSVTLFSGLFFFVHFSL